MNHRKGVETVTSVNLAKKVDAAWASKARMRSKCGFGGLPEPISEGKEVLKSPLQRNARDAEFGTRGEPEAPPIVHEVLRSSGHPLNPDTRSFMEPRFGHNFASVRVHHNSKAAESARAVNARAYTFGQSIVFGTGNFAPATSEGRVLLAHELAHTIQQRNRSSPPPSSDRSGIIESSASAAGIRVATGAPLSQVLPACGVGLARAPVTPSALDDQQLARELKRATEDLKPGQEPDWWLNALRAEAESRARKRTKTEHERAERVAAERQRADQAAAAERARRERDAAVAEAVKAGMPSAEPADTDEDEVPVTPMALDPRTASRNLPKVDRESAKHVARIKKAAPSKFDPGGFTDADIYRDYQKRIDQQIEKDREIAKKGSYQDRLRLVRRKLQNKSSSWYSWNEAVSKMTGEEVWREGVDDELFTENEKRAVYEDQNSMVQLIEEEYKEAYKRERAEAESKQYQAWVAKGEELSSPAPIVQPFLVAAAAPAALAAAYFGAQTGQMVGEAYNACAHGTTEECAVAIAKLAAAAAIHRATKGKPGANLQNEPQTGGTGQTAGGIGQTTGEIGETTGGISKPIPDKPSGQPTSGPGVEDEEAMGDNQIPDSTTQPAPGSQPTQDTSVGEGTTPPPSGAQTTGVPEGGLPGATGTRHLPRQFEMPRQGRSGFGSTSEQIGTAEQRAAGKVRVRGQRVGEEEVGTKATEVPGGRTGARDHWAEHGHEFPEYRNARQYEQGAIDFCRDPATRRFYYRHYGRPTIGYYNPSTNTFAATSVDGKTIYTYFRPENVEQLVRTIRMRGVPAGVTPRHSVPLRRE
jgi:hypothetical protein